jgi:HSP90 family molecular chaperone
MLDFENKPLKDLIAVGRNKGMSVILATQNMDAYKSKHFDFYANAQYPLIMKQQSINDAVLKDMYGVSGNELNDIKQAIASLQKGELLIKNNDAILMGIGKRYKKIMVRHLI